jgi:hypothetical protein
MARTKKKSRVVVDEEFTLPSPTTSSSEEDSELEFITVTKAEFLSHNLPMTQGTSNAVFNLLNLGVNKQPANDAKQPADDTEFLTLAQQMELEKHQLEEEEEELEEQEVEEEAVASEDEVRTVLIRKCSPFVPHPNLVTQAPSVTVSNTSTLRFL